MLYGHRGPAKGMADRSWVYLDSTLVLHVYVGGSVECLCDCRGVRSRSSSVRIAQVGRLRSMVAEMAVVNSFRGAGRVGAHVQASQEIAG